MVAGQAKGAAGAVSPFKRSAPRWARRSAGNIAGATAVISGGPGVLFWIWYGFVATAIKFSEAVLGVHFRQINGAHVQSGRCTARRRNRRRSLDLRARHVAARSRRRRSRSRIRSLWRSATSCRADR
jgi:hypothetical protein